MKQKETVVEPKVDGLVDKLKELFGAPSAEDKQKMALLALGALYLYSTRRRR